MKSSNFNIEKSVCQILFAENILRDKKGLYNNAKTSGLQTVQNRIALTNQIERKLYVKYATKLVAQQGLKISDLSLEMFSLFLLKLEIRYPSELFIQQPTQHFTNHLKK